jgi:hypothetical protein
LFGTKYKKAFYGLFTFILSIKLLIYSPSL